MQWRICSLCQCLQRCWSLYLRLPPRLLCLRRRRRLCRCQHSCANHRQSPILRLRRCRNLLLNQNWSLSQTLSLSRI